MVGYGVFYTFGGDYVIFKHLKKENGQAMVEFALVLPILLLFIGGIIDFGWIFHNQILVNNATREETRELAIYYYINHVDLLDAQGFADLEDDVADLIQNKATFISDDTADSTIMVGSDGKYGEQITVNFTGQLKILTPILSTILGENYNVKSTCTMRIEKN